MNSIRVPARFFTVRSFLAICFMAGTAQAEMYRVTIETSVPVKMRDGVTLIADVYRPDAEGRFPVLLERTPYNRAGDAHMASSLAAHGYGVIIQDTRGRFGSGGEFYPFRHESQDGFDTIEWAAAQPYSNGEVGMFGGSYVGATQMLAAISLPPHLKAMFPYVTASEYYDGWTYQSGALMQWFASSWSSGLAIDTLRRQAEGRNKPRDWVMQLPVENYRLIEEPPASALAPYFHDWVEHERDDDYWKPWKISDHYASINVKALHAGGWHDIFLKGTIGNYAGMRESSPAREDQRLLLGPWAHAATSPEGKIGDVVFGKDAVLDMEGTALRWFDYALKGVRNDYASGAPVRLFVMGKNVWRDEHEFPLARTRYTKYFLRASRALNTDNPADEQADGYEYDPANPVPTIGGRLCCGSGLAPGPADESPNEHRGDVLVFSTAPLADVDASGYARFLTDGIVRARYRSSTQKAEPIEPGRAERIFAPRDESELIEIVRLASRESAPMTIAGAGVLSRDLHSAAEPGILPDSEDASRRGHDLMIEFARRAVALGGRFRPSTASASARHTFSNCSLRLAKLKQ